MVYSLIYPTYRCPQTFERLFGIKSTKSLISAMKVDHLTGEPCALKVARTVRRQLSRVIILNWSA